MIDIARRLSRTELTGNKQSSGIWLAVLAEYRTAVLASTRRQLASSTIAELARASTPVDSSRCWNFGSVTIDHLALFVGLEQDHERERTANEDRWATEK